MPKHEPSLSLTLFASDLAARAWRFDWVIAVLLGLMLTLVSAAKPMGIDDAVFLFHGYQAGSAPLDPLGYDVRYERFHETALRLPCPPVVQYWLGLGYVIFGDHVVLMKLWMGPWAVLLAWASIRLGRPWAGDWTVPAVTAVFLTPIVFNSLNIMLDVPAAALLLTSLLVFRAYLDDDKPKPRLAVLAGVIAGLAMLAKYSACSGPLAIMALGIAYRRTWAGIVPGLVSAAVFWGWDLLTFFKYGQSHFFYTLQSLEEPGNTLYTLYSFIGLPGTGALILALLACVCLRLGSWVVWGLGIGSLIGYACVFNFIDSQIWLGIIGGLVFAWLVLLSLKRALKASPGFNAETTGLQPTDRAITLFLPAWLVMEMIQITVLSPFPAGRRMIVFSVVVGLIIGRAGHLLKTPVKKPSLATVLVLGLPMTAITWYADLRLVENMRDSLLNAAAQVRQADPRGERTPIYYLGLWNWQYYGPRNGMMECLPNQTVLQPGDWLISVGSGMATTAVTLDPQNYTTSGQLTYKPGLSLSFFPNYIDWTSIAYFGDGAVVVNVLQAGKAHVPVYLASAEKMLAILKHRKMPLPVGATGTLLFLAKTAPDPFHNPFADAIITWGEPWLHQALNSPIPYDRAYTLDLLKAREKEVPPAVMQKLLTTEPPALSP